MAPAPSMKKGSPREFQCPHWGCKVEGLALVGATAPPCLAKAFADVGWVVVGSALGEPAWVRPSQAKRPAHYLHRGLKPKAGQ